MQTAGSTSPSRTASGTGGPAGPPSSSRGDGADPAARESVRQRLIARFRKHGLDTGDPCPGLMQDDPSPPLLGREDSRLPALSREDSCPPPLNREDSCPPPLYRGESCVTGLKREVSSALELKREASCVVDLTREEPRRKRRRRGIQDPRLRLNEDVIARVLPWLARTSVRHLLLLSMVNKGLYEQITDAHKIWRSLYLAWENRIYPRGHASLGSEFAARCLQGLPLWMAPRGQHRSAMARQGVPVWGLPCGPANPPFGSDWREKGVPVHKREEFGCVVRKIMALTHIGVCGLCGTRRGHQRAVWALDMRVCRACWLDQTVSHRTLLQEYGLDILQPPPGQTAPLYQLLRGRVYYVRFCVAPGPRAKLTLAPSDFPGNELPCIPVWLLWLPHLSKFVDLPAARAAHRARLAAAEAIAWRLRGAFAHRLRLAYGGKQASSQGYLPIALRQNETRRRLGPPLIADPLEDWRNTCARQELMNHADRAPDPRRAVPLAGEAGQGGSGGSSVSGGSGVSGVSGVSCVSCVSGVSGLSCGAGATEQPRG